MTSEALCSLTYQSDSWHVEAICIALFIVELLADTCNCRIGYGVQHLSSRICCICRSLRFCYNSKQLSTGRHLLVDIRQDPLFYGDTCTYTSYKESYEPYLDLSCHVPSKLALCHQEHRIMSAMKGILDDHSFRRASTPIDVSKLHSLLAHLL